MTIMIIVVLALIPAILQLMAISMFTERMGRSLHNSADPPPYTTAVTIRHIGPTPQRVARVLDRVTRLDVDEIDGVIEAGGGRLPLLMSARRARQLVTELRQLGADVVSEPTS